HLQFPVDHEYTVLTWPSTPRLYQWTSLPYRLILRLILPSSLCRPTRSLVRVPFSPPE
ncbi:hypothetical protein PPYR_06967, partial [Photinus pyralis]